MRTSHSGTRVFPAIGLGILLATPLVAYPSLAQQSTSGLQRGQRDLQSYLRQGLRPVAPLPVTTPPRYQDQLPPGQLPPAQTAPARPRRQPANRVETAPPTAGLYEVERQRYVERMLEAQAEMQFWNQVTGYGLNGVVPLDAPNRFYAGNTPIGFPNTYLNTFEQWPPLGADSLPYPSTVYFNTAPGTQPTGFETVLTGPNSYIYRPLYGTPPQDQIIPPEPTAANVAGYEAAPPLAVDPISPDVRTAVELFQEQRYRNALILLDRVIAANVDDGSLELLRAQTLFARGDYQRAATSLQDALAVLPLEQWGLIATDPAAFYLEPQRYPEQIETLRGYVRQHPNDAAARLLLGYHLGFNGDPKSAAAELNRAQQLGASDPLGQQLQSLFESAAQQQAAEQKPTEPAPDSTDEEPAPPKTEEFPRRGGREL